MVPIKKPVPKSVIKAIKRKQNRVFLKRLYNLPYGTTKSEREKALNLGTKRQRHLLIHILHQVVRKEIPMAEKHRSLITQSGKKKFYTANFFDEEDVKLLLKKTDVEQREILAKVNNYHVLLYRLFNLKKK